MDENTPRLTENLIGPKIKGICQSCGVGHKVHPWREHDHNDKPEIKALFLCERCSKRLVGPHPRLYSQIQPKEPFPGLMKICEGCRYLSGIRCACPAATFNGGAGIIIHATKPLVAHVKGTGHSGFMSLYRDEPSSCSGRADEIKAEQPSLL